MTDKGLPNAELALMELLWNGEDRTARQIREELYPGDSRSQNASATGGKGIYQTEPKASCASLFTDEHPRILRRSTDDISD